MSSTLQDRLRNTIRDLHETIRESENDKCNFAIISNGRGRIHVRVRLSLCFREKEINQTGSMFFFSNT